MLRSCLVGLAVLAMAVATLASTPTPTPAPILHGATASRGPNVFLYPVAPEAAPAPLDAHALFIDSSATVFASSPSARPLDSTLLADVIAASLGAAPAPAAAAELVRSNALRRARANLLLSVHSLGADAVTDLALPNLSAMLTQRSSPALAATGVKVAQSRPVAHDSYPASPLALLTSAVTGALPAEHGIVACEWAVSPVAAADAASLSPNDPYRTVKAFVGRAGRAVLPTVADTLLTAFSSSSSASARGTPLTLAVSASPTLAAATARSTGRLAASASASLSSARRSFGGAADSDAPTFSFAELFDADAVAALSAPATGLRVALDSARAAVTVERDGAAPVNFLLRANPANPHDEDASLGFFAELLYAHRLLAALSAADSQLAARAADAAPDFVSLALAGLKPLVAAYGARGPHVAAAAAVLDAQLPRFLAAFDAAYGGRAVAEVLLLGSASRVAARPLDGTDKRGLYLGLVAAAPTQLSIARVDQFFPNLRVDPELRTPALCAALDAAARPYGLAALCPELADLASPGASPVFLELAAPTIEPQATGSAGSGSAFQALAVTTEDVMRFQICLWVGLGLIFVAAWALCYMANMKTDFDPQLYGVINPAWSQRRHR